jgi:hypothetical protein
MATLVATPAEISVGDQVSISGAGFTPNGVVELSMAELGISIEIAADAGGYVGSDDVADHASALLTLAGNAVADEDVVIGSVTYTWKASVAATADEVLVGADAAASLVNLKAAINDSGGSGYGSATVENPDVEATTLTATTLLMNAKVGGTAGNSLDSTETMTNGSFGDTTFGSGAVSSGVSPLLFKPEEEGEITFTASDGTNTASASVRVWSKS